MAIDPKKLRNFANAASEPVTPKKVKVQQQNGNEDYDEDEEWEDEEEGDGEDEDEEPMTAEEALEIIEDAIDDGTLPEVLEEALEIAADYDPEQDGNPPSWVTDEALWQEAKDAVEPKWDDYDEPYAVVTFVYRKMGGNIGG